MARQTVLSISYNRAKAVASLVFGVLLAVGMKMSLFKKVTEVNSPGVDLLDGRMVFWRALYRSMPTAKLQLFLLAVVIALLIYFGTSIVATIREELGMMLVAVLFSSAQIIAYAFKRMGELDALYFLPGQLAQITEEDVTYAMAYPMPMQIVRVAIRGISLAVVCYFLLKNLLYVTSAYLLQTKAERYWFRPIHLILLAALLFLAWLPYFLVFYPGTSNEDTVIMILEYFHIPSYIQAMSPMQGEDIFITNHHPYLLTLLFGRMVELGLQMGDIRRGIAIYSLCQMVFLALVFAGGILYLRHAGVRRSRCVLVALIVMFLPVFPLYAICMLKDTLYAAFALIYILMMYEVARTGGYALMEPLFLAGLFVDGGLMMLTKVYGVYILVIVGLCYLIKYRECWWRILLSIALPILLFQFLYLGVLLPRLGVAPGGIQEALSVPFQQTARYLTEYPDDVTKKEKEALDAVIPYKYWTKRYAPKLSDDLKEKYNQDATDEELRSYFDAWWAMFLRHPGVYVEATLHNTYEYYDIDKISSLAYYEWNTFLQDHPKKYKDAAYLIVEHDEETAWLRYLVNQAVLSVEKIPILNWFAAIGLIPWILIFFLLLNGKQKRDGANIALLIPILTFLICLTSPDNGNYRYIMPTMYALPYLWMLELQREA